VHQLTAIEPDKAAIFAGVNYHVAGTGIEMRVHGMVTLWAINRAVQIFTVGSSRSATVSLARPQSLDKTFQLLHGDQHAVASGAINNPEIGKDSMIEREFAQRAILARWLVENAHAIVVLFWKIDAIAEGALEALHVSLELHGSAAGGTVHCAFPHSAQNFAR
jgi:hypothetical protein